MDKRMIEVQLDEGAVMPIKAHESDAGYDLYSREDKVITDCSGGEVFDTGVHIAIPEGYVGLVQGRSGLNINHSIICPTGVIDAGYTGSIKVKLYNMDINDYKVCKGDKIAQLLILPIQSYGFTRVNHLEDTERGSNGFGSSGR